MSYSRVFSVCLLALSACATAGQGAADDDGDDDIPPPTPDAPVVDDVDAAPIDPTDADPDGAVPDAAVPDAAAPDAAVPDACVPSSQQILLNGNVDATCTGSGATLSCPNWTMQPAVAAYPPIVTTAELTTAQTGVTPQSGGRAVWIGGLHAATDALYQDIAIPASATSVTINGYRWLGTSETTPSTPHDYARVQIRNTSGTVLETLQEWSNANSTTNWTFFTATATGSYAGQTIRVVVTSTTDADPTPSNTEDEAGFTSFYFDTLAVNVLACP